MLNFLSALAGALRWLGQYFAQKQLLDAGAAKQQVEAQQEIEANVVKANDAVAVPDAARTKRLRSRFDQAYGNE